MELYGCGFEYAGVMSGKYGMIFANVETERNRTIIGGGELITIFNRHNSMRHYVGTSFENAAMQFEAEVVTEIPLTESDQRAVERWLFYRNGYKKFYPDVPPEYVNGEMKRVYLNCIFTNPSKLEYNGGVVGYRFTVQCDAPMAWQDPVQVSFDLNHSSEDQSSIISVMVDTDMPDYVYPDVVVEMGDGGGITIVNNSDNTSRLTSFEHVIAQAIIRMDGETNFVSGANYENFVDRNFIRLLNGENKLAVTGDVKKISFTWQNMRYL